MEDQFDLSMQTVGKGAVHFQVEVYYQTAVVIRFKLTAGSKELKLEKRLLQKSSQWKILSKNYNSENVDDLTTRAMFDLFNILDEKISGKKKPSRMR